MVVPLVFWTTVAAGEDAGVARAGDDVLWTEVGPGGYVPHSQYAAQDLCPDAAVPCDTAVVPRAGWRHRPFSLGVFMGIMQGSPLIDDWVGQQTGPFGGYRLGYDMDTYWGWEMQFGMGAVSVFDSPRAIEVQQLGDDLRGIAQGDPYRNRFDAGREAEYFLWDAGILFYPWGDNVWRPYLRMGLGIARVEFVDRLSYLHSGTVFGLPVAAGVKFHADELVVLRAEVADNIAFGSGSGFNTLHNLSITGGMEVRFGGPRKAYWPWNPGRYYW